MASWVWPHHPRTSPCLLSVSLDLGLPWITQGELIATPLDRAYFPARSCPQIPGRRMRHILLGATSPPPTDGNREQQPCCMAPGGGSVQFNSVARLLLTLYDPMDCGPPRLHVPGEEWPPDSRLTPHLLCTCHHLRGGSRDKPGYHESTPRLCAGLPVAAKICFKKMNDGSLSFSLIPFLGSLMPLPWQSWGKFLVSEIPGLLRQPSSQDCLHLSLLVSLAPGFHHQASLVAQMVKNLPAIQETWGPVPGLGRYLEKEMATHSSVPAWKIPRTVEPGGQQSMRSQRAGQDRVTDTFICRHFMPQFSITDIKLVLPPRGTLWDSGSPTPLCRCPGVADTNDHKLG